MIALSHNLQVASTNTNPEQIYPPSQAYLDSQIIQGFREQIPGLEPDLKAK